MSEAFYRQVEVLDNERHRNLCLNLPGDMRHARNLRDCPVLVDEFYAAARHYPIVFARMASGELMSAVVLGWPGSTNLWLDENARWRDDAYVPAYVRRYPFVVLASDASAYIGIDRAYAGWSTESGLPLFDASGDYSEALMRAGMFLDEYVASHARTRVYLNALQRLDLLRPFGAEIGDGAAGRRLENMLCVSAEALDRLSSCELLDFVRAGHYALTVAHQMSLDNFKVLADLDAADSNAHS